MLELLLGDERCKRCAGARRNCLERSPFASGQSVPAAREALRAGAATRLRGRAGRPIRGRPIARGRSALVRGTRPRRRPPRRRSRRSRRGGPARASRARPRSARPARETPACRGTSRSRSAPAPPPARGRARARPTFAAGRTDRARTTARRALRRAALRRDGDPSARATRESRGGCPSRTPRGTPRASGAAPAATPPEQAPRGDTSCHGRTAPPRVVWRKVLPALSPFVTCRSPSSNWDGHDGVRRGLRARAGPSTGESRGPAESRLNWCAFGARHRGRGHGSPSDPSVSDTGLSE